MNILLINPPVYLPTTYPYSITALKAKLLQQLPQTYNITTLDLNAKFHKQQFFEYYKQLTTATTQEYFALLEHFYKETKHVYAKISKAAYQNKPLSYTKELLDQIIQKTPDVVAFSVTYNSQIFLTKELIKELQNSHPHIKIVIGGPADYSIIIKKFPQVTALSSAEHLVEHLLGSKKSTSTKQPFPVLDFSEYNKEEYFTKDIVYPIRTSIACPYGRCTFCTHHGNKSYKQFDLTTLKQTIAKNKIKKIAFIDDDLTPKRLNQIAEILEPLDVKWWCQLRPIKQIKESLATAANAGLSSVAWGVESANQRVLNLIQKGTNPKDIQETLTLSNQLGIKNQLYLLFGFPTETKEEFEDTINFLKKNKENIHLVSPSIFGLQFGSKTLKDPELFDIKDIHLEERTLLSPKITYKTTSGLTQQEVKKLKKQHNHTLNSLNKVPKIISIFKGQILNLQEKN